MSWSRDLPSVPGFYWIDSPGWPTLSIGLVVCCSGQQPALLCGTGIKWSVEDFTIVHPDVVWCGPVQTPNRSET